MSRIRNHLFESLRTPIRRFRYAPFFVRDFIFCFLHGWRWDSGWRLYGLPLVRCRGRGSRIEIGRSLVACSRSQNNVIGVFQPVILATCRDNAQIVIGDSVGLSGCTVSAAESIRIGNNVLIGAGVLVTDSDWHPLDPTLRRAGKDGVSLPVVIEDDVFVGARAIILKGVRIGSGSVVGAGAVVVRDVPPRSVVAGNPARVIGVVPLVP